MRISDLPDDLLIFVLVRLPIECLGQSKCVSKSWNSLISSQKFIKSHLNQSRIVQKPNVLVPEIDQIQMVEFSITGGNMDLYKDFDCKFKRLHCLPELLDDRVIIQIVGSSNGLLCLLLSRSHESCEKCRSFDQHDKCCFLDDYVFAFCNPLTKSTWDLPGNQWKRLFSDESLYGFWYDDVDDDDNDYKVVILNHVFDKGIHEYVCEVYSLRSNSWGRVHSYLDFSYDEFKVPLYEAEGVLVNCALHWIIWNDQWIPNFILALDLRTYKHKILPLPEVPEGNYPLKLTVLNGSLVLSNGQSGDLYNLWVMKDYGSNDSWMRITIHKSYIGCSLTPLALLEDNNNHKRILVSYDDFDDMLKLNDLVSHQGWNMGKPCNFHNAKQLQFVGSLVQPYPPSVGYEKIFSEDALKNFDKFHIHVNGVSIDSQLPELVRRKYYDLCSSKKSFLHERLVPGLHSKTKLAASMITEAVNIADSIRSCKFTTLNEEFEKWGKSLRSFELLGMNVGFLRDRLTLALKSCL